MVDDVLLEAEDKMEKAVEALKRELASIRTGRANPSLVERLPIEYYGVPTPLNQLASISAPEPRLLVIQPWDSSTVTIIEKAILRSDLGLTPSSDGKLIRLAVPSLTEERRRQLVRLAHKKVEEGRVAVRSCRREALESLREMEKEKLISEDDLRRAGERLQQLTDAFIVQVDRIGLRKEEEILEV